MLTLYIHSISCQVFLRAICYKIENVV